MTSLPPPLSGRRLRSGGSANLTRIRGRAQPLAAAPSWKYCRARGTCTCSLRMQCNNDYVLQLRV